MPKPYSIDLREKIVTAYENQEGSMQKLAERFSGSHALALIVIHKS